MLHNTNSNNNMKSRNSRCIASKYLLTTLFLFTCFSSVSVRVFSFLPTARYIRIHNKTPPCTVLTKLYGSKKTGPKKRSGRPRANHEKWQPYFEQLSKYVDEHGHCNVKEEEDPSLFNWVLEQQQAYMALQMGRKTKLTRKRAVALEQLGVLSSVDMDNPMNDSF